MFTGGKSVLVDIESSELVRFLEEGGKPELPDDMPEKL